MSASVTSVSLASSSTFVCSRRKTNFHILKKSFLYSGCIVYTFLIVRFTALTKIKFVSQKVDATTACRRATDVIKFGELND